MWLKREILWLMVSRRVGVMVVEMFELLEYLGVKIIKMINFEIWVSWRAVDE